MGQGGRPDGAGRGANDTGRITGGEGQIWLAPGSYFKVDEAGTLLGGFNVACRKRRLWRFMARPPGLILWTRFRAAELTASSRRIRTSKVGGGSTPLGCAHAPEFRRHWKARRQRKKASPSTSAWTSVARMRLASARLRVDLRAADDEGRRCRHRRRRRPSQRRHHGGASGLVEQGCG